jgi:2-dehydro-3-deoxy-L-rhamnonate dehydrogenase (NAD+)
VNVFEGRFAHRTAVITGGASGLGREVARRIVSEGGTVALWDIGNESIAQVQGEIGASYSVSLDVTNAAGVARAAAATNEALGGIDILVNSAGITGATVPVHEFPVESWLKTIDVNLNGVFYCCREVIPFMLASGYGRIVNVSSMAGKEGNPNACAYSASKAGVIAFTKSLGKELATRGIVANAIAPAAFESPILKQLPQSHVDYMRSKIPMQRLGSIDEIAAMVCFMASQECSFTTGFSFDASGGRSTY